MYKYCLAAATLKGFSCSPLTKRAYRRLGNKLGGRRRARGHMPPFYLERVNRMLRIAKAYGVPKNGSRLIELGTGWLHWEAITTRLFFDVSGVLFDVWDNRQIDGLRNYLEQLGGSLHQLKIDYSQRMQAQKLIAAIREADSYEALYKLLGFEYVVDPRGDLDAFKNEGFDVAVSAGVMEHIYAGDVPRFINGIAGLLKPGGYSIDSINIRDHLYQYDHSVSSKQYLHYSGRAWNLFFGNDVQYINRIQRSEWLRLFEDAGLGLVEEDSTSEDLSGLKIAADYQSYDKSDLSCGGLDLVHRKLV